MKIKSFVSQKFYAVLYFFILISTFFFFQNCARFDAKSLDEQNGVIQQASSSCTNRENLLEPCEGTDGIGVLTCAPDGSKYCQMQSCSAGFNLIGNQCLPVHCSPGSIIDCNTPVGFGVKTCDAQGSGFGECTLQSCTAGYNLQNGVCVQNMCTPLSQIACSTIGGTGTATCNAAGTGYDACKITSCKSGYHFEGTTCVANTCAPNTVKTCSNSSGSGSMTCNSSGTGYGACQITQCNAGYTMSNGICIHAVCAPSSKEVCTVENGTGYKTCNSTGSGYGSCMVSACSAGYHIESNSCVKDLVCKDQWVKATGSGPYGKSCLSWLNTTRVRTVIPKANQVTYDYCFYGRPGVGQPWYMFYPSKFVNSEWNPKSSAGMPTYTNYISSSYNTLYEGAYVEYLKQVCQ